MRAPTHSEIAPYVERGLVKAVRHPDDLPLTLYNYTQRAQFDRMWDAVTLQCRGLILDNDDHVVARGFDKFFNYSEHEGPLPDEPFRVYEKLDGCLLIAAYHWDYDIVTATRGSFDGMQAELGRSLLFRDIDLDAFCQGYSYCFELISPDNRIVVDYGDRQALVLLDVLDNETGRSVGRDAVLEYGDRLLCSVVPEHTIASFDDIPERPNAEGYVVHFQGESDLRLKIKHREYVRLHRLITGLSERTVWEYLSHGKGIIDIIADTPDECHGWVDAVANRLWDEFEAIKGQCFSDFLDRPVDATRKEVAQYFLSCKYPSVLFLYFDGHHERAEKAIWDLVKPKGARTFREADEAA